MPTRPPWCQDRQCVPDANTPSCQPPLSEQHGHSGFCVGRVTTPLITTRGDVEHVNDGHFCFRSPVRGVVMLEINEDDLDLVARITMHSLAAREPNRKFNLRWYTGRTEPEPEPED